MHNHFGIAVGLENRALPLQPAANLQRIHQIAVVRHRNRTFARLHQDRLRVQQRRIARRRIARMPDGQRAAHLCQHVFGKNVGHQPHRLVRPQRNPVRRDHPRRLLPAMLQGMQPEVGKLLRLGMVEDRHHAALVVKFIETWHLAIGPWQNDNLSAHDDKPYSASYSASTSSGSAFNAACSADSYVTLNSATEAAIATCPSTLISSRSAIVSPRTSAAIPCCPAICWIRATWAGSQEMTMRLASSPNSTNSAGKPCDASFTRAPTPFGNAFSASATASPPSEQSCTDSARPWRTTSITAFCSAASFSRSSSGGYPHSCPRISLAYSDDPNSLSTSVISAASPARNSTIVRPAAAKGIFADLRASSRIPTTPSTGVG